MFTSTTINLSRKGTLFIPDISGFTQFVNQTEISHSQHIIEELLEIIILETGDSFEISEIEGDAVLFYRFENEVDYPFLIDLSVRIFLKFHQHLGYYSRDRVCNCGACSTSENLTLKFIIHSGWIQEYSVRNHRKLLGKDVILAHRLMKNNIPSREYILISNAIIKEQDNSFDFLAAGFEQKSEIKEDFETVDYWAKSLTEERIHIQPPPKRLEVPLPEVILSECITIRGNVADIIRSVTEPALRIKWMKNLRKIELKGHRINRIKTSHECLIGQNKMEVTLENLVENENEVKLVERAKMNFPKLEFFILYSFKKTGEQVEVSMGNSLEKTNSGRFWAFSFPIVRRILMHQNFQNLKMLKMYVEQEVD